ncbi:hypothetical protein ACVLD2_002133 [Paenibacillus sp. PvR052]
MVNRNLKKANVDVHTRALAKHSVEQKGEVNVTFEAAENAMGIGIHSS